MCTGMSEFARQEQEAPSVAEQISAVTGVSVEYLDGTYTKQIVAAVQALPEELQLAVVTETLAFLAGQKGVSKAEAIETTTWGIQNYPDWGEPLYK